MTVPDSTTPDSVADFARRLGERLAPARQRRALVLAGDRQWGAACGAAVWQGFDGERLWLGDRADAAIEPRPASSAVAVLGTEHSLVVFDAWAGFDVDAFGQVAGTLRAGGLLVLLVPPLAAWPDYPDPEHRRIAVHPVAPDAVSGRFLHRLARVLVHSPGALVVGQGGVLPELPELLPQPAPQPGDPDCATADQRAAVEALIHVVQGQRRRPVVLTADRGRGKSAALGIAAARLLERGLGRIVVTAPRPEAVTALFAHAARLLPKAASGKAHLHHTLGRIDFLPPDALALETVEAGLVLVDEAAAIPAPLLEQMLVRYPRMAFATTVHGYEGTGRGFALRFNQTLDRRTRGWRALRLNDPVRWAEGDPLEQLVFAALLLAAEPSPDPVAHRATADSVVVQRHDRTALAGDDAVLSELFGLLVQAHYRTRPFDLRHLLDGPNIQVWSACSGGHVIATALVAEEGGFDGATAWQVWAGLARPHGHLIPETLAAHLGLEQGARARGWRVMRIAVHPAARRRGIGRALIGGIADAAASAGADYIGTSFGATPELVGFWGGAGYRPVRVSSKRGAASGAHSVLMLHALSEAGRDLESCAADRFAVHFAHQLADLLADLEPSLVSAVLRTACWPAPRLDPHDWSDLVAFAWGRRSYEAAIGAIWKLAPSLLPLEQPDPVTGIVLVRRVLQRADWATVARETGLSGRSEVLNALREALRPAIERWGGASARELTDRLKREA